MSLHPNLLPPGFTPLASNGPSLEAVAFLVVFVIAGGVAIFVNMAILDVALSGGGPNSQESKIN